MPKIALKRQGASLVPAAEKAEEYIAKWPEHEVRLCDVKRSRNPDHHRKAFAILNRAFENQDFYPSVEMLLEAVKVKVGYVREVRFKGAGPVYYVTQSISFASMGQDEFEEFYEMMLSVLPELTGVPMDVLSAGYE